MEDILKVILKPTDERKKVIYFILTIILSIVIASKIYVRLLGDFDIILVTDYKRIITEFFLTGRFVICLMIITAQNIVYTIFNFFVLILISKLGHNSYNFLRNNFNEFLDEVKTNSGFQWIINISIKLLEQLGMIDKDNGRIKPGIEFYYFLHYFRKLNQIDDKETQIDTSLSYGPIPITVQMLVLFDFVFIDHFQISYFLIITLNVLTILLLAFQLFIYFVNIFIDLKKDKILKVLEQFEQEYINGQNADTVQTAV